MAHWLCFAGSLLLAASVQAQFATYYVSPTGNDVTGDGSMGNPWQSVGKARDYIYASGASYYQNADIIVNLRGGRYEITNTLAFSAVHSGGNGHYISYQSYPGETAVISGGKQVTGWTNVPGKPYWVASVPTNAGFAGYFRQLYVNGVRAERARSDWIAGTDYFFDPNTPETCDGISFAPTAGLKNYSNVSDLRLLHTFLFPVDEFPVTGITTNSTNGLIQVALQQPYCQKRYSVTYGTSANPNLFAATDYWMVVNAFEELDQPGEWYLNRATQQVFYYPNSFEDMTTAVVYAPVVETLVDFTGSSTANKVQNIRFQGITFEHGNWSYPGRYFIGCIQAEILYNSAGVANAYEVPGQIKLVNTSGIQFIGNTIQHQGSCGIHPYDGARNTLIQGNLFSDLTGAAVIGGHVTANAEICSNTVVADNVIRNIGMDYYGGTAVNNLRHYGFQVLRNDMADSAYMGFHQRNEVQFLPAGGMGGTIVASNRIAMANSGGRYGVADQASIYSFGVWPNSFVSANDIYDLNQPTNAYIFDYVHGLYQDNNSYGWTWSSNVVRNVYPGMRGISWVRSETNDPNVNVAIGNFTDSTVTWTYGLASNINFTVFPLGAPPPAAQTIIQGAGLGPSYAYLSSLIYSGNNLAQGKYVWASSQLDSFSAPTNAVNWNYNDKWQSAPSDTNCWLAVDLGIPYVIQRIELAPRTDTNDPVARQNFQIQAANSTNFASYSVLAEQNGVPFAYQQIGLCNSWVKFANNTNGWRYLRIKKADGSYLSLSEFQVYGYPAFSNTTYVQWDAGAMGGITDGSGDWSATNKWWNGTTNQSWADNQDAVIGNYGVPGTITVTNTSPQFNSLTLNPVACGNYVLTGNPLRIASGTINANAATTISNNITGLAALAKNGIATLTLAASNNFPGVAAINQGTVKVSHPNALGTSSAVIQSGATLDINGQSLGNGRGSVIVAGNGVGGNGAIINSGASQIQAMTNLVLTADTTVSTVNAWHLRNNTTVSRLDMGGHTLTKIGGNQLYIQLVPGVVQNPGNVVVSNGNFMIGFSTWSGAGVTNTMTFHSGTTFQIYKGSANYVFSTVLNGATLRFSPEAAFTGNWTGGIALSGTSTILAETNVTLNGGISGSGNLVKTGTGTLTLGGTNTYYGNTTVSNGTLRVANANFAPNSTIAVATNSVLQLDLAVTNTITNLVLNGVSQPLGVYGSNNTAYITGPGSLRVGTAIPTTPTNLNYAYSNNVLTLSWPSNYLGCTLQVQTNALGTNWFTLPGTAFVTMTNITINTTNVSVFYRLVCQP